MDEHDCEITIAIPNCILSDLWEIFGGFSFSL